MASDIIIWDLETVPDLRGYARANNLNDKSLDEVRAAMGDEFPKLIYHSIICIGALVALERLTGTRFKPSEHPTSVNGPKKS